MCGVPSPAPYALSGAPVWPVLAERGGLLVSRAGVQQRAVCGRSGRGSVSRPHRVLKTVVLAVLPVTSVIPMFGAWSM